MYGDVNLDGRIDVTDAVLLNKMAAGAVTGNDQQRRAGDCNVDGEVDTADSVMLLQLFGTHHSIPRTAGKVKALLNPKERNIIFHGARTNKTNFQLAGILADPPARTIREIICRCH